MLNEINERLKEVRKLSNKTQKDFGAILGVTRDTLASYESGRVVPNDTLIRLICKEFKVNYEWLANGKGEKFLDALPNVEQCLNDDKKDEFGVITVLTAQIELLQEQLRQEREYNRQHTETIAAQSNRIADIAEQLAELTRNSQILHKQEQHRQALISAPLQKYEDGEKEKQSFWQRLFGHKGNVIS